jgi:hypothetical protein
MPDMDTGSQKEEIIKIKQLQYTEGANGPLFCFGLRFELK